MLFKELEIPQESLDLFPSSQTHQLLLLPVSPRSGISCSSGTIFTGNWENRCQPEFTDQLRQGEHRATGRSVQHRFTEADRYLGYPVE